MSEKPSEYMKRTCLICGCHTNQTINIYEPRSGPNIVQLIQAKFKFQPLNEDKYLCFSCNNWLINWHSLQALNSNDAESPSGTFRSHMNNMVPEKGSGSQRVIGICRPVAAVRPLQVLSREAELQQLQQLQQQRSMAAQQADTADSSSSSLQQQETHQSSYYAKRSSLSLKHLRSLRSKTLKKSMQTCCVCGKSMVVRMRCNAKSGVLAKKSSNAKCRKCADLSKWRSIYVRSLLKAERFAEELRQPGWRQCMPVQPNAAQQASIAEAKQVSQQQQEAAQAASSKQFLARPLIDGKVVSALRRLGTTLSRENNVDSCNEQAVVSSSSSSGNSRHTRVKLPTIMSPAKVKPRWNRQLEEDEILLDFDTAISEVLPTIAAQSAELVMTKSAAGVRRRLQYQISAANEQQVVDISNDDDDDEVEQLIAAPAIKPANQAIPLDISQIYKMLPKGLSVSLV